MEAWLCKIAQIKEKGRGAEGRGRDVGRRSTVCRGVAAAAAAPRAVPHMHCSAACKAPTPPGSALLSPHLASRSLGFWSGHERRHGPSRHTNQAPPAAPGIQPAWPAACPPSPASGCRRASGRRLARPAAPACSARRWPRRHPLPVRARWTGRPAPCTCLQPAPPPPPPAAAATQPVACSCRRAAAARPPARSPQDVPERRQPGRGGPRDGGHHPQREAAPGAGRRRLACQRSSKRSPADVAAQARRR